MGTGGPCFSDPDSPDALHARLIDLIVACVVTAAFFNHR
jgi:hypothetical protein